MSTLRPLNEYLTSDEDSCKLRNTSTSFLFIHHIAVAKLPDDCVIQATDDEDDAKESVSKASSLSVSSGSKNDASEEQTEVSIAQELSAASLNDTSLVDLGEIRRQCKEQRTLLNAMFLYREEMLLAVIEQLTTPKNLKKPRSAAKTPISARRIILDDSDFEPYEGLAKKSNNDDTAADLSFETTESKAELSSFVVPDDQVSFLSDASNEETESSSSSSEATEHSSSSAESDKDENELSRLHSTPIRKKHQDILAAKRALNPGIKFYHTN